MHVQWLGGHRAQGLHDQGADRDVGHETSIHHVHMDPVSPGGIHSPHVLAQPGEIGRENRRGDHQRLGAHDGRGVTGGAIVRAGGTVLADTMTPL